MALKTQPYPPDLIDLSPGDLQQSIRSGAYDGQTGGLARGFVQANVVILPSKYASDFQRYCHLNPKPCPLLDSGEPGEATLPSCSDSGARMTDASPITPNTGDGTLCPTNRKTVPAAVKTAE